MKNRLLALGATLAVLTSGGCEAEQKDVCSSTTNISENVQCDVEDVITDIDTDNDERHPRDDRSPRTSGENDDVFDEEDTTDDIDTIEDSSFDNDIIEEDTIIDYQLDPSTREDCSTENGKMNNLISQYEGIVIKQYAEIIEEYENMREILNRYNLDIYFKERVQRFYPNENFDLLAVSGYGSNESFEQFTIATQAIHRNTQELRGGILSIMMEVDRNDSMITSFEFTYFNHDNDDHTIHTYNFRYDPNTNEMSGCTLEYEELAPLRTLNTVDNLCLDLCEDTNERIPRYMPRFFESEYSQPAE